MQLQRNTLLSLASDTRPNHVPFNLALVLRVLQWGVLPLLSVAAAQYPNLASWLYVLIAPFARALH